MKRMAEERRRLDIGHLDECWEGVWRFRNTTGRRQEIAARLGESSRSPLSLGIQVLGALYLGFAGLNWTAKDSLIGGLYNRPVAMANLLHVIVGALALVKALFVAPPTTALMSIAAIYAMFAVAFAMIFFTSPVKAAA